MADYNIGTLFYKITGDTSALNSSLKTSETNVTTLGTKAKSLGTLLKGAAVAGAVVYATKKVAEFALASIDAASDAEESANAVSVVFGDATDDILDFADKSVDAVGLSSTAFKSLATVTGSQLKAAGTDVSDLGDQVIDLTTRAADVASVFNTSVDDALSAFNSALRGEAEPARAFAVNISDAAVQAEALASGLVSTKDEITDQIKVQARYNLILQQTTDFAGDFTNTQEGFSNQVKIAKGNVEELKITMGEGLLPIATASVAIFADLTSRLTDFIEERERLKEISSTDASEMDDVNDKLTKYQMKIDDARLALEDLNDERTYGDGLSRDEMDALDEQIAAQEAIISSYEQKMDAAKMLAELEAQYAEDAAEAAELQQEQEEAAAERAEARLEAASEYMDTMWDFADQQREMYLEYIEQEEGKAKATEGAYDNMVSTMAWALEQKEAFIENEIALDNLRLSSASTLYSALSTLAGTFADESAAMFAIEQATASASAFINSYLAFTEVLSDPAYIGQPWLRATNAAAVLASGLAAQSSIIQTTISGFEDGGIVGGTSYSGDNVPVNVNSGEMILNAEEQKNLWNAASGGTGGSSTINVYVGSKKVATEVVDCINNGQAGTINSRVVK